MRHVPVRAAFKQAPAYCVAVLVAFGASCGSGVEHDQVVSGVASTDVSAAGVVATTVSDVKIGLPAGFGSPRVVAGDIGAGAWFMASSAAETRIFHLAPTGTLLKSWKIADWTSETVGPPVTGALAEDTTGNVWLGAERTLYQLDPSSGKTEALQLPTLKTIPELEARRSPELQGTEYVDGLAVSSSGDVAVTLTGAAQYLVVHKDGSIAISDLPPGTEAVGVVYDGADEPNIALRSYRDNAANLVLRGGESPTTVSVPDSNAITAVQGTVIAGQKTLTSISTTGATSTRPVGEAVGNLSPQGSPPKGMPDGGLAVSTSGGVARLDASGTVRATYRMPEVRCLLQIPPTVGEATGGGPVYCQENAEQIAVDGAGGIWIIPSLDTGGLYLAPPT